MTKTKTETQKRTVSTTFLPGVSVFLLLFFACGRGGAEKLIYNCREGNLQIVTVMLERGFDPNAADTVGTAPLMAAAEKGHLAIVELLLEKGANSAARNKSDHTALDIAVEAGFTQIAAILKQSAGITKGDSL